MARKDVTIYEGIVEEYGGWGENGDDLCIDTDRIPEIFRSYEHSKIRVTIERIE